MKILVVGGGGREHAIIKKLKQNREVTEIFALPGNGGIAKDATCVEGKANDIPAIVSFAKQKGIDYVVVAPDDPLVLGCVDELEKIGIPCFGPNKNAAVLEGSKVFSKNFMKKYEIPTAEYTVFSKAEEALEYLKTAPIPTVIKADGLALGKGVIIATTRQQAQDAVREIMQEKKFGKSGEKIVIEEFLEGPEVSVLAFTDGKTLVPMVSSMDHKKVGADDTGANTGGMGAIAPNPYYTEEIAQECMQSIFLPTIQAMENEGRLFKGCLYFGLMLTAKGPKVIEYNCRFGDPETQAVLPLLESDLLEVMQATSNGTLDKIQVKFAKGKSSCCVVLASKGYPEKYETGYKITVAPEILPDVTFAGVTCKEGELYTSGGRVLGVVSVKDPLEQAVQASYEKVQKTKFENVYYRNDIGKKALEVAEKKESKTHGI